MVSILVLLSSVVLLSYKAFAKYVCSSVFTSTIVREQLKDSVAGGCTVISVVVTREVAVCGKPIKHIVGQTLSLSSVLLMCHLLR